MPSHLSGKFSSCVGDVVFKPTDGLQDSPADSSLYKNLNSQRAGKSQTSQQRAT